MIETAYSMLSTYRIETVFSFQEGKNATFFKETRRKIQLDDQPLLITRFNFNPGMDKWLHPTMQQVIFGNV